MMATLGTFVAGQVLTAAELNAIGTWTTWNPTVTSATGTITAGTLVNARYTQLNKLVILRFEYTVTTAGTAAGAFMQFTLPESLDGTYSTGDAIGVGRESGLTGNTLNVIVIDQSNSIARIDLYDNTGWIQTSRAANVVCWYEVA